MRKTATYTDAKGNIHEYEDYGSDPRRKPTLEPNDTELFSEHGRCLASKSGNHGIDYRSHWFVLVQPQYGFAALLVAHGAGQERIVLDHNADKVLSDTFPLLTSDQRYLMLHLLYSTHTDARRRATDSTAMKYKKAFVDGKLKKKRRDGMIYVNIVE